MYNKRLGLVRYIFNIIFRKYFSYLVPNRVKYIFKISYAADDTVSYTVLYLKNHFKLAKFKICPIQLLFIENKRF